MTVQKCVEQLDLNKEGSKGHQDKTKSHTHVDRSMNQTKEQTQMWSGMKHIREKQEERTYTQYLPSVSTEPGKPNYFSRLVSRPGQDEPLNMTTNHSKDKTATIMSATQEISAMEFMRTAVRNLEKKVQKSGPPFLFKEVHPTPEKQFIVKGICKIKNNICFTLSYKFKKIICEKKFLYCSRKLFFCYS